MNLEEKTQYHNEVKTALYEYIEKNELQEVPNVVIMTHLQGMFQHLSDNNLVKYGLTYELFCSFASEEYMFSLVRGIE